MSTTEDSNPLGKFGFRRRLNLCQLEERRPVREILAALSLIAWMLVLLLPWWNQSDYAATLEAQESGANLAYQLAGLLIAVCGMLCGGIPAVLRSAEFFVSTWKGIGLTMFVVYCIACSVISIAPARTLLYSVATLGVLFVIRAIWEGAGYRRIRQYLPAAGLMILAFLLLLYVRHGLGTRTLGGIRANQIGKSALVALVCFCFLNGRTKWIGVTAALLTIVAVSSRGSLLAAMVFLGFQMLTGRRPTATIMCLLAVTAVAILWELSAREYRFQSPSDVVRHVMKIDDPQRGIGTGFTGRSEFWHRGLGYIEDRPLLGYGFRTRQRHDSADPYASAHSGFLNLAIDVGLIGAFFLLAIFVFDVFTRLKVLLSATSLIPGTIRRLNVTETCRVNQIVCGMYFFTAILWLLEPSYLNIGIPHQILFFTLLCAPTIVEDQADPELEGFLL